MPHRAEPASPASNAYNPHMAPVMRGRPPPPPPPPPPPMHMIHPSDAARMAAMHHQQTAARGYPPPPHHYHHVPPPMWHPADIAASHHQEHSLKREALEPPLRTESQVESAEKTAASALLMASNGAMAKPETTREESDDNSEQTNPTKKRKKHLDVLRRNQNTIDTATTTGSPPCHVSPVSASSADVDGQSADEAVSIVTHSTIIQQASSGSYDLKDPKSPHFPSDLHRVLSMPDAQTVLQWLPHGQAWKIVRWDALRREIMPKYFPDLCKGEEGGSIDSFLWQVRAWGFEEIKDGPDAGAYSHISFIRGTSKLCKHMTFNAGSPKPNSGDGTPDKTKPQVVSSSILRVPSLMSRSDGDHDSKPASPGQHRSSVTTVVASGAAPGAMLDRGSPVHHQHHGWPTNGMTYRTYDGAYTTDARLVHHHSPVHHGVTFPPPYSPRFPFRTYPGGPSLLLKSGRGGSRTNAARRSAGTETRSFPVSQRGRGRQHRRVPSSPNQENSVASSSSADSSPTGLGPHLQRESSQQTVSSIARKMKRKLPLTRKTTNSEVDETAKVKEPSHVAAELDKESPTVKEPTPVEPMIVDEPPKTKEHLAADVVADEPPKEPSQAANVVDEPTPTKEPSHVAVNVVDEPPLKIEEPADVVDETPKIEEQSHFAADVVDDESPKIKEPSHVTTDDVDDGSPQIKEPSQLTTDDVADESPKIKEPSQISEAQEA